MELDQVPKGGGVAEQTAEPARVPPEPGEGASAATMWAIRWAGPAFSLFALVMVPWTAYLAYSLPSRQLSPDYDIAWAGFDVLLMAGLAGTAFCAFRRSRVLAAAASATAAMLVVDAWFDVVTSPASQRPLALVLAAFAELPLAAVCVWLTLHTQQIERHEGARLRGRGARIQRTGAGRGGGNG